MSKHQRKVFLKRQKIDKSNSGNFVSIFGCTKCKIKGEEVNYSISQSIEETTEAFRNERKD